MTRNRRFQIILALGLMAIGVVLGAWPRGLQANGGTLRLSDVVVGPYRMAVFTDPTPMRPDSVDVSVLVLDPESGDIVPGLVVKVEATDGVTTDLLVATREQADDPDRYYAAKFVLPNPGTWTFTVIVDVLRDELVIHSARANFSVRVRERGLLGNPFILTALLLLPLLGLAAWMIRGTNNPQGSTTAAFLAAGMVTFASCVTPERTPPYEELAEIFAVEDARQDVLPPELVEATNVQSPMVRAAAYRAMGRHERNDWMAQVAKGLRDPDPEVRVVAINATAQSAFQDTDDLAGAREALRIFTAALGGERHPRVRAAIALAAGRLGKDSTLAEEAELVILEVFTEPGEAALFDPRSIANPGAPLLDLVRGSFALARASGGTHPARDELTILLAELTGFGRSADTPPTLDATGPALTAGRIRRAALGTLLTTGRLSGPVVVEASRDSDPGVRATLAAALGSGVALPERAEVERQLADDPAPQVLTQWIAAYGRGDRALGCEPLLKTARDGKTHAQLAAIDALAGSCPAGEIVERANLLGEIAATLDLESSDSAPSELAPSWHAPAHATVALARLGDPAANGWATALAQHENPFARTWAARAFTALGDGDALTQLAADPDANVRSVAIAGAVAALGTRAMPLVIGQLQSSAPQLVMTAASLLEGQQAGPAALDALWTSFSRLTASGRETDRDARMAVLEQIGALASSSDSSRLRPTLEDYDPAVAARAAEILESWTGRPQAASARPFDPEPMPSAEELERLDGALVELSMESGGTIRIQLRPLLAPTNAVRIARLVDSGVLNGLTFHRVVPGFVIQGGSPGANEYAGHGAFGRDEIGDGGHWRGTVGLSTRGRDTGDGQMFVNLLDNLRLDNNYTIYGHVVEGMDVVDRAMEGERITSASILPAENRR